MMSRRARIWIDGGAGHDEEFCFEGFFEFFQKLREVQARRQMGMDKCKLHLHGELQTSQNFRLPPKGDVDVDVLSLTAQGASSEQQQRWQKLQQQHEELQRKARELQEINDQLTRQKIENRISGEKDRAEMLAKSLAKEQERLRQSELEIARYKAVVGKYFNSIGTVTSECFGVSRRKYHNLHEHSD